MRCVPQTAVSEHDLDGIAVLQVLDYSGGRTLDDLIEYVEKQMAGVSDEDDDESDSDDSDDEGEEPEVPKDEL